jgi:hypothetical protein
VQDVDMLQVYNWLDSRWPGELLYYKKRGHIHAALPKLNIKSDHLILDK